MTTLRAEIQSLSPSALIELFVLDMTNTTSGGILYFHAGTNGLSQPIVWQGQTYEPWPVKAEGFDYTTQGTLPRPKFFVANIGGVFSGEVSANNDLVGCKLTRKRTLAKFLDAVNFPSGNANADASQEFPDEMWFIDQKVTENRYQIEFALSSVFDLMGVQLPFREVIKNSCPWRYRGAECGYTGPYIDVNDAVTTNPAEDTCPKFLKSCKARCGTYGSADVLPFGGFPGATKYDV